MWEDDLEINGYRFQLTCFACPEQYDVYKGDEQVAYIRLRWGALRATVPDVGGEEIYTVNFLEENRGVFPSPKSRAFHLTEIAKILQERNKC
jgi:hypothetical protein